MKKIAGIIAGIFLIFIVYLGFSARHNLSTAAEYKKYLSLGFDKDKIGDYAGAIEAYTKAIEINPELAVANRARAEDLSALKKYKEAVKDFDSAIRYLLKTDFRGKFSCFIAKYTRKDLWAEGVKNVKGIEEEISMTYRMRGGIKTEMKDYKAAGDDFNRAIKYDSNNPYTYASRAMFEHHTGDYKGALADLDKAIALNEKDINFYGTRSEIKKKLGDNKGAMQDLNEALKIEPDPRGYNNRADLKNTLGDYSGALIDINKAIAIEPKAAVSYCTRGEIENNLTKYSAAVKDFSKAIELAQDNPQVASSAYYNRGLAEIKLNKKTGVIEDLKKAADLGEEKAALKLKEIQGK